MKKIYSIEDLCTKPFDDEEIEKVSNDLIYSLIIGMFHTIKVKDPIDKTKEISNNTIIEICSNQNEWFNKYSWTQLQREKYKKKLDQIFYNLYSFGPIKCSNSSDEFLLKYGFKVKPSYRRKNKNI